MMVEVWAAVAGASITVAGVGVSGINRQARQGQDSLIRLTAAVDNLSGRLDILHNDIKTKDMEVFARLNELERSVARLEGHTDRH
jgi:outer membrane murein-binding lipoprotein Lpp